MTKLKDFVNLTMNKRNNQMSLNIKKNKLKDVNLKVDDILNLRIPLNKKLQNFENL